MGILLVCAKASEDIFLFIPVTEIIIEIDFCCLQSLMGQS